VTTPTPAGLSGPLTIADALSGKRILVTGATGFLGTALVERLLRAVPECEVAVLVRPTRRSSAAARLAREVVRNDCFDRLREDAHSFRCFWPSHRQRKKGTN